MFIVGAANEDTNFPTRDRLLRNASILEGLVRTFEEETLCGILHRVSFSTRSIWKMMNTHCLSFLARHIKEARVEHLKVLG